MRFTTLAVAALVLGSVASVVWAQTGTQEVPALPLIYQHIGLSYDSNPPADNQQEAVELIFPAGFVASEVFIFVHDGPAPCNHPLNCASQFHLYHQGQFSEFHFQGAVE